MKYNGTDKYCYNDFPGVLINKFSITNDDLLDRQILEKQMDIIDGVKISSPYSLDTLCRIHQELFSCAFDWAGKLRDIDISKGTTRFCTNAYLIKSGKDIFRKINELNEDLINILSHCGKNHVNSIDFNETMKLLGGIITDLNMLHPFREGNGRTLRLFIELFLYNLGITIYWPASPVRWMNASISDDADGFTELLLDCLSVG